MRNSIKFLFAMLMVLNLGIISCTKDSLAEVEKLENINATEGDQGEVIEEPDDED
ncbi:MULTISPECIES: hypothetical protein [Aquimarina]|uniref:hypothetical protein n=1 Tax=Aquimarina TaxID=290174 RepID=UPI00131F1ECE|nr:MULTISPECIES: hypothetical protein [Aquimarina]